MSYAQMAGSQTQKATSASPFTELKNTVVDTNINLDEASEVCYEEACNRMLNQSEI